MSRLAFALVAALAAAPCAAPITAGAAPLPTPAPAPAQNDLSFTSGAWRGGAVRDNSGAVEACAMVAPAGNGIQLFFRLTGEFDFSLGLINPRWSFATGTALPMVYWIDNGAKTEVQARVTRADTLHLDITDRESIFQQFRRGLWLHIAAQSANARFSLKGTSAALERLRVCATAIAAQAAPPAPPPAPAPTPPAPTPGK